MVLMVHTYIWVAGGLWFTAFIWVSLLFMVHNLLRGFNTLLVHVNTLGFDITFGSYMQCGVQYYIDLGVDFQYVFMRIRLNIRGYLYRETVNNN
jgi:hypothetical protein